MKSDGLRHLHVTPPRDKLNEARYFLNTMIEKANDWDAFRFNLDSFLSVARSVTWIMAKHYAHFDGFQEWLKPKQVEMSRNPLMKYFTEQRNQTVKQRTITSSLPVTVREEGKDPVSIYFIDGTGGTSQPLSLNLAPREKTGSIYYFSDFPEKDVVSLCRDYLLEVEKVVEDWESRFQREDRI
ncbi:MAG: hypothetical protein HY587_04550 [Candidatus Omnitrophica bacterium]|nr:hypothetical protein [Candidatus Omnitrophota bacterium]